MSPSSQRAGFTLLEISIVLVIIGLLAGGVLVGKELVKTAELRAMINEVERYTTAVHTFRTKYNYLPGDFPRATQLWGSKADCENEFGGITVQTFDGTTCDGNKNGIIDTVEGYLNQQHLSNAKLIPYMLGGGINETGNLDATPVLEYMYPPARFRNLYIALHFEYGASLTDLWFRDIYEHIYTIYNPTIGINPSFTPDEAFYVDSKIDDGKPALGKVRVRVQYLSEPERCTTSNTAADALYNTALYSGKMSCGHMVIKAPFRG